MAYYWEPKVGAKTLIGLSAVANVVLAAGICIEILALWAATWLGPLEIQNDLGFYLITVMSGLTFVVSGFFLGLRS